MLMWQEMLKSLFDAKAISFELDDEEHGGMNLICGDLSAVPAPSKMKATLLQQFDTLAPALQARGNHGRDGHGFGMSDACGRLTVPFLSMCRLHRLPCIHFVYTPPLPPPLLSLPSTPSPPLPPLHSSSSPLPPFPYFSPFSRPGPAERGLASARLFRRHRDPPRPA